MSAVGQEKPRLNAAARAAVEEGLAAGYNMVIRVSAEGKVVVETMSRKIVYRTP